MGIAVPVPGLDAILPEVPDGSVFVLEGGLAPAKSQLARALARSAAQSGRKVTLVSTRSEHGQAPSKVDVWESETWPDVPPGRDIVADSFSLLCLDEPASALAARMRRMKMQAVQHGTTAVLVVDQGQFGEAAQAACHHLADAVLQFRTREDADGPIQYLRVAKSPGNRSVERNIFYALDGDQLLVDTRRRVS